MALVSRALMVSMVALSSCRDVHTANNRLGGVVASAASATPAGSTSISDPGPTQAAGAECVPSKSGKDYEVGPGARYEHVIDVPWELLGPGDTVRIHAKDGGYHEKILLSHAGTDASPLVVCGISGPKGERPILDGSNAKTRGNDHLAYAYDPQQERGVFIVSLDKSQKWGWKPHHLLISGLDIRHAHPDYAFTGSAGEEHHYVPHAAGLFIERGEDITVRDCAIDDNANGFFVASGDDEATQSRRIVLERSYVFGNGTTGKGFDRHHNIYTEAVGMTFQFNRVGPLRDGAGGSALKDRSAGTIVRYNWIEGGSRSLDLVEAEDSYPNEKKEPTYPDAWVYGNAIVAGPEGASNVVHFGGDNGLEEKYRNGTLFFYDNTVVIRADQAKRWRTALFELATNAQNVDARNNLVFVTSTTPGAPPTNLTLMNQFGHAHIEGLAATPFEPFAEGREVKGTIDVEKTALKLDPASPPFRDVGALDLRPSAGFAALGTGVTLAKGVPPIEREYVAHLGDQSRVAKDIGAFEHVP